MLFQEITVACHTMGGVTSLNQSSGCVSKVGCLALRVSGFSRWSSSGWDDTASTYISCEHLQLRHCQAPTSGVCKHSWHPCSCCTSETSLGSYGEVPLAPEYMSSQAKDLISRQVPAVRHVTGLLWVSVSRSEHKVVYFALFYL